MFILRGLFVLLVLISMSAITAALLIVNDIVHKDRFRRRLMDKSAVDEAVDEGVRHFERLERRIS